MQSKIFVFGVIAAIAATCVVALNPQPELQLSSHSEPVRPALPSAATDNTSNSNAIEQTNAQEWHTLQSRFIGNLWAPNQDFEIPVIAQKLQSANLKRLEILVGFKRATPAEHRQYLTLKITHLTDRLELLEHYHERFNAIKATNNIQLIPQDEINEGLQVAEQLKVELAQLKTELNAI